MERARGRPNEEVLSRSLIVEAASALIEEVGVSRFSVNVLAAQLGVTPRAIRYRTGSRAELLVTVADATTRAIAVPPVELGCEDWLRLTATSVRSTLLERPGLIPVVLDAWATTVRGAELAAASLDVLVAAANGDLGRAVAAHNAYWAFLAGAVYSHSVSALRAADRGTVESLVGAGQHGIVAALDRLSVSYAATYPGARAADVAFEAALEVALAGIAAVISSQAEPSEST